MNQTRDFPRVSENRLPPKRDSGRDFSERELAGIRELIASHPMSTRADLSCLTCKALRWFKVDGGLKEMSCRVAMLRRQEEGLMQLPAAKGKRPESRIVLSDQTAPQAPIEQPANHFAPLQ